MEQERTTSRGIVVVYMPDHPHARKDGFVPRARLVMERQLKRTLDPAERVLHLDGDPANDRPENLMLFPTQQALAQYRSEQYHKTRKLKPLSAETRKLLGRKK